MRDLRQRMSDYLSHATDSAKKLIERVEDYMVHARENPTKARTKITNYVREHFWNAYEKTEANVKKYSTIGLVGTVICVVIGTGVWRFYQYRQLTKDLERLSKEDENHTKSFLEKIESLNKRARITDEQLLARLQTDYVSPELSMGFKHLARQQVSYRAGEMIGSLTRYPERYPGIKYEELTDLVIFTMLAEEQQFVSESEPDIKDDKRFQDLTNRLGPDNNYLLDSFHKYNALSQKIIRASLGRNFEEWDRATKQREDLLFELMKWDKTDEPRRKLVRLFLHL